MRKPRIIKLERSEREKQNEPLLVVGYNEFVLPYVCNVESCDFTCFVDSDFVSHLSQKHQRRIKFCCHICIQENNGEGCFAYHPNLLILHYKQHHINLYQCFFCLFGTDCINTMMKHLAMEHFEYEPICLERSLLDDYDKVDDIDNLKTIKITKVIDNNLVQIFESKPETNSARHKIPTQRITKSSFPDALVAANMKFAFIGESNQSSDINVITVPNAAQIPALSALPIDNYEFIMLDHNSNQNDTHETLNMNQLLITETETIINEHELQKPNEIPTQRITKSSFPDIPSAATMKFSHTDESNQSSDITVTTVPNAAQMSALNASAIDNNEFIMLEHTSIQNDTKNYKDGNLLKSNSSGTEKNEQQRTCLKRKSSEHYTISDVKELEKRSKHMLITANDQQQQALNSIEPTVVPTCRGIPIESISSSITQNKYHSGSKGTKSKTKNMPDQAYEQKSLSDTFSLSDNLGTISSHGLFKCSLCKVFQSKDHLLKDVKYKMWKCMKCSKIFDSGNKMGWHAKKLGNGKYKIINNNDKLSSVERVIEDKEEEQRRLFEQDNKRIKNSMIYSLIEIAYDIEKRILHSQATD